MATIALCPCSIYCCGKELASALPLLPFCYTSVSIGLWNHEFLCNFLCESYYLYFDCCLSNSINKLLELAKQFNKYWTWRVDLWDSLKHQWIRWKWIIVVSLCTCVDSWISHGSILGCSLLDAYSEPEPRETRSPGLLLRNPAISLWKCWGQSNVATGFPACLMYTHQLWRGETMHRSRILHMIHQEMVGHWIEPMRKTALTQRSNRLTGSMH